ncbi:hypothetical protein SOVF_107090 [Spinacia oleracea]|nr:hypothetical protein SOVF_107090 [Spinacia oleracea]
MIEYFLDTEAQETEYEIARLRPRQFFFHFIIGSKSLRKTAQIFTGAFWQGFYEPPADGFHFEVNDDSPIVQDDPTLFDYNVQDRVNSFVAAAICQANVTRFNYIMWTMGTYFKYQYAHTWFRKMDKLILDLIAFSSLNCLVITVLLFQLVILLWPHRDPHVSDDVYNFISYMGRVKTPSSIRSCIAFFRCKHCWIIWPFP